MDDRPTGLRVGLVSQWFNRGQATVARYLRGALDESGHETCVLARPTREKFTRPAFIDNRDVWDQPGVTAASSATPPPEEYLAWASANALDVVLVDQNYQFDAMVALRRAGVRVIGRFVWESVREQDVAAARTALDVVYSFTLAEQARYARLGLDSPRVPFGVHPELLGRRTARRTDGVDFFYPAGYLSKRKPTGAVLEAFRRADAPGARLILKAQRALRPSDLVLPNDHVDVQRRDRGEATMADLPSEQDAGVVVISDDLSTEGYHSMFASCHVCVAVSRWEGLGLHLYEAVGFGQPQIALDAPPVNEVVRAGVNGILTSSRVLGATKSGVESREPDVDDLARAFTQMSRLDVVDAFGEGVKGTREILAWRDTVAAVDALVRAA